MAEIGGRRDEGRRAPGYRARQMSAPTHAESAAEQAVEALADVVGGLPGGVLREGQQQMAGAVAAAIADEAILAVEAPTGVGKSLGYLVPAVTAERRDEAGRERPVVVATATKALQEQLVASDLPRLAEQHPELTWAVAKGRSNYVCRARLDGVAGDGREEALFAERVDGAAWQALLDWAERTETGDRTDAPEGVTDALWSPLSVSASECPGARRCPFGDTCFAEDAKARVARADVVVTNQHLLLLDAAFDGALLPEAAVTLVDEGHRLVDAASSVLGVQLSPGRLRWLARRARSVVDAPASALGELAGPLAGALEPLAGTGRVDPAAGELAVLLERIERAVSELRAALRRAGAADAPEPAQHGAGEGAPEGDGVAEPGEQLDAERTQAVIAAGAAATLAGELTALRDHDPDETVAWVEGGDRSGASLRLAPVDVAGPVASLLRARRPAVLTSATLTVGGRFDATLARWGLDAAQARTLRVASPFDHRRNGVLFVPRHLPDPRADDFDTAASALTLRLVQAAGGRSLVLFTSWRRLEATADWLADQLALTVLRQGTAAPSRLVARFRDEESSVLCATASFWEGVDAPGRACVQVIIDKLPFPRRDDPLIAARREHVERRGGNAFAEVDLPIAAVRLAQGVGRLIRSSEDFGVVTVLDRRLATARYRTALLEAMPPLWRTVEQEQVTRFLAQRLDDPGS